MMNRIFKVQPPENALARQIIGLAMKVHRTLGCGFLETIYRNALIVELRNAGIPYECHVALPVRYEGIEVGIFPADLIIDGRLIVELKAVDALHPTHYAQLINYLCATKIETDCFSISAPAASSLRPKLEFIVGQILDPIPLISPIW